LVSYSEERPTVLFARVPVVPDNQNEVFRPEVIEEVLAEGDILEF